ncbi:BQ2448_2637 [Microbotryum intermedium]|uniref:BQ2448_2637 protein n=1 Tax=Microbotryum intermedium TaxID=269621 RepID=A0A238F904_9BASI|nr:BQ2448_2637 [Microbotryum intermedium]
MGGWLGCFQQFDDYGAPLQSASQGTSSEAPESLPHLAVGCPFARRLWAALSPSPHPIFADFVCPLVSRSERRIVELRILFFHSIWKLSRRRRFSSQPLEPITEAELEELRGSIQGCTGRLASL